MFNLTQQQLRRALFPLGNLSKKEVRELAREMKLPVADKPESQQLCFLQGESQGSFIQKRIPNLSLEGKMVGAEGEMVASHPGIHHFTIGQRRGLGVAVGEPQYVVGIDPETHEVRIGSNDELMKRAMSLDRMNWVGIDCPGQEIQGSVRIRYKHEESSATIRPSGETCHIEFVEKQRAITPGQAAVIYDKDLVLGGGWIQQVFD